MRISWRLRLVRGINRWMITRHHIHRQKCISQFVYYTAVCCLCAHRITSTVYAATKYSDNDRKFVNKRFNVGMFINRLFLLLYEMKWKQQQNIGSNTGILAAQTHEKWCKKNCIDYLVVQAIVLGKWAVKHLPKWKHTLTKWGSFVFGVSENLKDRIEFAINWKCSTKMTKFNGDQLIRS